MTSFARNANISLCAEKENAFSFENTELGQKLKSFDHMQLETIDKMLTQALTPMAQYLDGVALDDIKHSSNNIADRIIMRANAAATQYVRAMEKEVKQTQEAQKNYDSAFTPVFAENLSDTLYMASELKDVSREIALQSGCDPQISIQACLNNISAKILENLKTKSR